jgi:hypothetical protein
MDIETPSRKHRTRVVAFSFSSLLSSLQSFLFASSHFASQRLHQNRNHHHHLPHHHQVFANITTPIVLHSLPSKPSSRLPLAADVDSFAGSFCLSLFYVTTTQGAFCVENK